MESFTGIFKRFAKLESYIFLSFWNLGATIFKKKHLFFLNKKLDVFEIKKSNVLGQIKPRFSFWLKESIDRKMASNKHIDLRKIKKNFVRSKCYPGDKYQKLRYHGNNYYGKW